MTDTLTQRARDVAGRLLHKSAWTQQKPYWHECNPDGPEAAAIISELVERIEGLEREAMIDKGSAKMRVIGERLVTSYQSELDRINAPSVLGKQEGEG